MELLKKTLFSLENLISTNRGNTMKLLYVEAQLTMIEGFISPEINQDNKTKLQQQAVASFRDLRIRVNESGLLFISRWFLLREIDKIAEQTFKELG